MKRFLIIALLLSSLGTQAQDLHFLQPQEEDFYIYYPFYKGVQLVELDLNGFAYAEATYQDFIQPINSIRMVQERANPLLLRDRQGRILAQYNSPDRLVKPRDLLDPDDPKMKTVSHREAARRRTERPFQGLVHVVPDLTIPLKTGEAFRYIVLAGSLYGVLDTTGRVILDLRYEDLNYFDGHYSFSIGGKYGLMDRDFQVLIKPRYTTLQPIGPGRLLAGSRRVGIMDYAETLLLDTVFEEIRPFGDLYFFRREELIPLPKEERSQYSSTIYGVMDRDLDIVSVPRYVSYQPFVYTHDSTAYVYACGFRACGLLDAQTGEELTAFDMVRPPISQHNGYYLIDRKDFKDWRSRRVIADSHFRQIGRGYDYAGFVDGQVGSIALAGRTGEGLQWALMDVQGRVLTPYRYDRIRRYIDGFYQVESGGGLGMINREGKEVLRPRYHRFEIEGQRLGACYESVKEVVDGKTTWIPACEYYLIEGLRLRRLP